MVPLLQEPHINPHATLITLFMNVVDENMTTEDQRADITPHSLTTKRLHKYLPRTNRGMTTNTYGPEIIKISFARDIVKSYDNIINR